MRRCGNSRRKGHDVEAKEFGRFIAGMRKEKKMTQAELAEKIHVTDKAVSRWERGLGFPDIQTIEPLAQALGISVLELMRSERQEKAKEEAAPEIQYTQKANNTRSAIGPSSYIPEPEIFQGSRKNRTGTQT